MSETWADLREQVMKRLKAQDWYDVADLFGTAADGALECGDDGLNSVLAHEKAFKMMRDMAMRAHEKGMMIEAKNRKGQGKS